MTAPINATQYGASFWQQALIDTIQRVADATTAAASVTTNSTLTGDGSPSSPLGVVGIGSANGLAQLGASGRVPQAQLASGTASAGAVPTSDGSGGTAWTVPGSGGITAYAGNSGAAALATDPARNVTLYIPNDDYLTSGITRSSDAVNGTVYRVGAAGLYLVSCSGTISGAGGICARYGAAVVNSVDPALAGQIFYESNNAAGYPLSGAGVVQLAANDYVWFTAAAAPQYPSTWRCSIVRLA